MIINNKVSLSQEQIRQLEFYYDAGCTTHVVEMDNKTNILKINTEETISGGVIVHHIYMFGGFGVPVIAESNYFASNMFAVIGLVGHLQGEFVSANGVHFYSVGADWYIEIDTSKQKGYIEQYELYKDSIYTIKSTQLSGWCCVTGKELRVGKKKYIIYNIDGIVGISSVDDIAAIEVQKGRKILHNAELVTAFTDVCCDYCFTDISSGESCISVVHPNGLNSYYICDKCGKKHINVLGKLKTR